MKNKSNVGRLYRNPKSTISELLESRLLLSTTYDAAKDFSLSQNPNGPWSYGVRSSETAVFAPFAVETSLDFGSGAAGWNENSGSPPYVGTNVTGAEYNSEGINLPAGVLIMHPGSNGEYSDVRFTVPTTGTVDVNSVFTGIDTNGTTTDVAVLYNGQKESGGNITGYGVTNSGQHSINVTQGDTLDFIVGTGTNKTFYSDATSLSVQITTAATGSHLVFSKQPADSDAGSRGAVQVKIEDASGHVLTKEPGDVTLNLVDSLGNNVDSTPAVTERFVSGTATFTAANGPLFSTSGTFELQATHTDAGGISTSALSNAFAIAAPHLVFTKQPGTIDLGESLPFALQLVNSKNKAVSTKGLDSEIGIGFPSLSPHGIYVSLVNGKYDHTKAVAGDSFTLSTAGTFDMQAWVADPSTGNAIGDIADITVTVVAPHLIFTKKPGTLSLGESTPFALELVDGRNKLVSNTNTEIGIGFPTLSPQAAYESLIKGKFDHTKPIPSDSFTIPQAGTFEMEAWVADPSTGNAIGDTTDITVTVVAPHLIFTKKPGTLSLGESTPFALELVDGRNKPVTNSNTEIGIGFPTLSPQAAYESLIKGKFDHTKPIPGDAFTIPQAGTFEMEAWVADPSTGNAIGDTTNITVTVVAPHLIFTKKPSTITAGESVPFALELVDGRNKPVTNSSAEIGIGFPSLSPQAAYESLVKGKFNHTKPIPGDSFTLPAAGTFVMEAWLADPSTGNAIGDRTDVTVTVVAPKAS